MSDGFFIIVLSGKFSDKGLSPYLIPFSKLGQFSSELDTQAFELGGSRVQNID